MKASMISFTGHGRDLSRTIEKVLKNEGWSVKSAVKCAGEADSYPGSLKDWTGEWWKESDALIYIGAAGIAVRAIAPFIVSKKEDPAVLVVDELGKYCIPLLSGHIGGANAFARMLSEKLSMQAVITTATDLNHKWAVDVFAKENHLHITDMKLAKTVSAEILRGKSIFLEVEPEGSMKGEIPEELRIMATKMENSDQRTVRRIHIGVRKPAEDTLGLIPQAVILGIGCKKGTSTEKINHLTEQILTDHNIAREAVKLVASIDLKKEEPGLCEYCNRNKIPFRTFSKEELEQVEGTFARSEFVKKITGVDNVCERSAICAGGEKILVHKTAMDGVTVAVAVEKWSVNFE